jgi:CHAT domain-containing protein
MARRGRCLKIFWRQALLTVLLAVSASPVFAVKADKPPSLLDSFRLGTGSGAICRMQSTTNDPIVKGMFDRGYSIVCRDAARAVGHVYVLRRDKEDPAARADKARDSVDHCSAPGTAKLEGIAGAEVRTCKLKDADVDYLIYQKHEGKSLFISEGLQGYDSALQLAMRTVHADRLLPGEITVATSGGSDPAAFARVQAGSLDAESALAEGYRRNNSGNYAEAAEFFETLSQRSTDNASQTSQLGEYIVNRALQKSNMGEFNEADALFQQALRIPTADPVQLRLRRNFIALHLMNQRKLVEAMAELNRKLADVGTAEKSAESRSEITPEVSAQLNSQNAFSRRLGAGNAETLTPEEKATVLDAQALQLKGTVDRLQGHMTEAVQELNSALTSLESVRQGRVASISRLRAQMLSELSSVAESRNDPADAEKSLRDAVGVLGTEYPGSAAVNAANARLAAFLGRHGQTDASIALYRDVVTKMTSGGSTTGFENLIAPYFEILLGAMKDRKELVNDFFLATETLVRPGVASTQAVLARELSGGSGEAARLFRQATNLTRDVERTRIELARLKAAPAPTPAELFRMATVETNLAGLERDQVETQAKLGQFPQYRAISTQALTLPDLQKVMKPREAYMKMAIVGETIYLIFATHDEATAFRSTMTKTELEKTVDALRGTISVIENGQQMTYPLDVVLARKLYVALIEPVDSHFDGIKDMAFEPDGAMLRLPPVVLISEQKGVDHYLARIKDPKTDEFDFREMAWLGRKFDISTSVSARSFRDTRGTPASSAKKEYLGFGQNDPMSAMKKLTNNYNATGANGIDCNWPSAAWDHPISGKELRIAADIIGPSESTVIIGPDFSDTTVKGRTDLTDYRIVHFATHGLVAAPRAGCPARPALLTSWGDKDSDGLLTFQEIYDLRFNADLIILSACDTAGAASVDATREIGLTSGGGSALDGLVRSFIGAGGRSILASHWPLPDDFNATARIINGLFTAPPGTPVASALRAGQLKLMDEADTSHPYYWAGLALIGDGEQPVLRPKTPPAPQKTEDATAH